MFCNWILSRSFSILQWNPAFVVASWLTFQWQNYSLFEATHQSILAVIKINKLCPPFTCLFATVVRKLRGWHREAGTKIVFFDSDRPRHTLPRFFFHSVSLFTFLWHRFLLLIASSVNLSMSLLQHFALVVHFNLFKSRTQRMLIITRIVLF